MCSGPTSASRQWRFNLIALLAVFAVVGTGCGTSTISAPPGPVLATITVGARAGTPAVGAGAVWVPNTGDGTVSKIDPARNQVVQTIRVGDAQRTYHDFCEPHGSVHSYMGATFNLRRCDIPSAVAATTDSVWVAANDRKGLIRLDPRDGHQISSVDLGVMPFNLLATNDAVWVTSYADDTILRIDPASARVVATIHEPGEGPSGLTLGEGAVWFANSRSGTVVRIDPASNRISATIPVPCAATCFVGPVPLAMASGFGSIWVRNEASNTVCRIDPASNRIVASLDVGSFFGRDGLDAMAVTPRGIFLSGVSMQRIDPVSNRVTPLNSDSVITLGYGFGSLWATDITGRILRIDPGRIG